MSSAIARVQKAERSLIRAAMGIVNSNGFAFLEDRTDPDKLKTSVIFPGSMRRLESAIARLKEARKAAKPRRRKYT